MMLWEWSIMNRNENKQQVTGACCTATSAQLVRSQRRLQSVRPGIAVRASPLPETIGRM
jgi:hypothetical protein